MHPFFGGGGGGGGWGVGGGGLGLTFRQCYWNYSITKQVPPKNIAGLFKSERRNIL